MSAKQISIIQFSLASFLCGIVLLLFTTNTSSQANKVSEIKPTTEIINKFKFAPLIHTYDSFLIQSISGRNIVGAAVTVIKDTTVLFQKPYGLKDKNETDSVTKHTIFRLGSVSKGFAGILASMFVEQDTLQLNDRVNTYLPGFKLKDSVNTYNMNLEHVLSHSTGLVPHAYDNLLESRVPMNEIVPMLKDVEISAKPGELYGYQNVMYSLIDTIINVKTGKNYSYHLRNKLFAPLNMYDASISFNEFLIYPDKAMPHTATKYGFNRIKQNSRYYEASIPAAGVNASISDLSKWVNALLGNQPEILSTAMLDTAFKPRIKTPLKRVYFKYWKNISSKHYGLGWRIVNYKGKSIVYHGGYVKGYKCEIALCRSENIGIAYITNSPCDETSKWLPKFFELYFTD